jgi:hypothetical protein
LASADFARLYNFYWEHPTVWPVFMGQSPSTSITKPISMRI